jgi:hypothetical protein
LLGIARKTVRFIQTGIWSGPKKIVANFSESRWSAPKNVGFRISTPLVLIAAETTSSAKQNRKDGS